MNRIDRKLKASVSDRAQPNMEFTPAGMTKPPEASHSRKLSPLMD